MNRGGGLVWEIDNGPREAWREEERVEQEGVGRPWTAASSAGGRWRRRSGREEASSRSLSLE